ncbi:MAG TPA: MBL fold metallo-hydrolase [Phycisphaerae bacterium]|nr:MBL fold metallo-hydrolase [Phycisphaerae bacterium]HRW54130.1 MBL fold metallo-hydrolase [Phycisphaerae bacterium]
MFMRMIYDEKLAQAAYLIGCQRTGEAIVIDPERDVDRYIDLAAENGLKIVATAETHIHADFVSGSRELAERVGARVYVSDEGDADWKYQWLDRKVGGESYDYKLLKDDDTFRVGNIGFRAIHTPGHTPEHMVFLVTDHGAGANEPIGMATGDFVFVGDLGRPDLLETAAGQAGAMEPSARRLYKTLRKLDDIPDFVQVWPAHGAGSACGKALGAVPMSTIGYEKRFNPAINAGRTEQGFVDFILTGQPEPPLYFANMKRDNKIGPPVLGRLPIPPRNGVDVLRELDGRKVAIIDTRSWDAFRAGHVPGSLSFPMTRSFNTDAGSMVRDTDEIYLIIEENQLEEAVRDLIRVGLDHIRGWFDPADVRQYADTAHTLAVIEEVSVEQAIGLVESKQVQVLDVRRATEFAGGHLPNATNVAHTRLAARMDEVPRNSRLLVNCRSGARSARATAFLKREGLDVINLKGGMIAWEKTAATVEH